MSGVKPCPHADQIVPGVLASGAGCKECLETGGRWVHLRMCLGCGHVGCCDSSPSKHATAHFRTSGHAIMRSVEPGETWGWCYLDKRMLDLE
jgi:ubiquitin-hydrolase Zn-finger-containing protein